MPDLDLRPSDYRKQDPATGRWLQNVDRRLCFWGAMAGLAFLAWLSWFAWQEGSSPFLMVGPAILGMSIGGLLVLSLKRPDW